MPLTNPLSPLSKSIRRIHVLPCLVAGWLLFAGLPFGLRSVAGEETGEQPESRAADLDSVASFVGTYCVDCHNSADAAGSLDLESFTVESADRFGPHGDTTTWENMVRRLRGRQMPPSDAFRPDEAEYEQAIGTLVTTLDQYSEHHPHPGRASSLRRLTRTEYRNSVRDLLGIELDVSEWLPVDPSSHGFDNITVGELSPTLLNRYISAAEHISRLAVGRGRVRPSGVTIRLPANQTQEGHVEGLPLGTRGGTVVSHVFPLDGEYEIQIRLMRDRDERVEGLHERHEIHLLIDRELREKFTVKPPPGGEDFTKTDAHLRTRVSVTAGPHEVGVTLPDKLSSLLELHRQPFDVRYNRHRHPRLTPAIYEISIDGPFGDIEVGDTPSRQRIFTCLPDNPSEEQSCAEEIIGSLARRAFRRPVTTEDLTTPLEFFEQGRAERGFEYGIQTALASILVNPNFLFRVERDPSGLEPETAYRISDIELASRLSFFLWSSIPDDQLLSLAEAGQLSQPDELRRQTMRMLADERASSLVESFAGQWLYLRNLDAITPDLRLFADFDHNLRESFRRETELLFADVMSADRSVLDLIRTDEAFLNERLAQHYDVPHVFGSQFRKVELPAGSHRGGLLRQGSILMVTSYATRTSPTIRGSWVLENIFGTPPPPPPPNVPALKEKAAAEILSVRERLAEHRANPACASCHDLMDPVGFALENYDAVGRWRELEEGQPIDTTGSLPDGVEIAGVDELEDAILRRPEMFVGTMVEKLMTFALGRGVEPRDGPAVRRIVRDAAEDDYRFSSLIVGIVSSQPFQMRTSL